MRKTFHITTPSNITTNDLETLLLSIPSITIEETTPIYIPNNIIKFYEQGFPEHPFTSMIRAYHKFRVRQIPWDNLPLDNKLFFVSQVNPQLLTLSPEPTSARVFIRKFSPFFQTFLKGDPA